jgi:hypothetical protein
MLVCPSLAWRQREAVFSCERCNDVKAYTFMFTPLGYTFVSALLFNGNVQHRGAAYLSELLPNM